MTRPFPVDTEALAEDALLLRFGDTIDVTVNARVHAIAERIRARLPGVECVPAYASLLLRFDPSAWSDETSATPIERVRGAVDALLENINAADPEPRLVEIPVLYGDDAGPDLVAVAAHAGLSVDEIVARHAAVTYRVAMLGFAPGFPYLLGLDPALAMPRRDDPRLKVPAGSVAIGGQQTGIYPQALPGGWHLIGRTPLRLFDPHGASPSLLRPGDSVRFQPIDAATFQRLAAAQGAAP